MIGPSGLYERPGRVEMRLQLGTEALGPIELRTVLRGDRVAATITVKSTETGNLLHNQLPSLQQALADRRVVLDSVRVLDSSIGGDGRGGGSQTPYQHPQTPNATGRWSDPVDPGDHTDSVASGMGIVLGEVSGTRLNVRA